MRTLDVNTKCPTAKEYDLVLSGKAAFDQRLSFYNHLAECSLCSDAFEGYKNMQVQTNAIANVFEKKSKGFGLKGFAYAATIAILIGGYFFLRLFDSKNVELLVNDTAELIYEYENIEGLKTLRRNIDLYFSINNNGQISLNDQVIQESDIDEINFENGGKVFINVATQDHELPQRIIDKLKQKQLAVLIY